MRIGKARGGSVVRSSHAIRNTTNSFQATRWLSLGSWRVCFTGAPVFCFQDTERNTTYLTVALSFSPHALCLARGIASRAFGVASQTPQQARAFVMRLFSLTVVPVHGILKAGIIVVTRGKQKECSLMRKHIRRWLPIVLLGLMATLGYAVRAKNATQLPCRPSPDICQPKPISPPCQPFICPDADTR